MRRKAVRREGILPFRFHYTLLLTLCPQWFQYKNSFPGHTANAYEDDSGNIHVDLGLSEKNVFFW